MKLTFTSMYQAKSNIRNDPMHVCRCGLCADAGYAQTRKQPHIGSAIICSMCVNKISVLMP